MLLNLNSRLFEEADDTRAGGAGGGDADVKWFSGLEGLDESAQERLGQFESPAAILEALDAKGDSPENWPDDWRTKMIADLDEGDAKLLERYADPQSIAKALVGANKRISEGFKPEPFPEDGTDEQKAAWRESAGIPAAAADYAQNVGDGIVIGEDDSELFASFAETAHAMNMPQEHFDAAAKWYMEHASQQTELREEQDVEDSGKLDTELSDEYGAGEYKANKNNLLGVLTAHLPKESLEALLNARMPNGTGVFNDKGVVQGLIKIARELNPIPTLVSAGNDPGKSIENRLKEFGEIRKKDYDAWMANDALRSEERELLEARDKLKARAV